MFEEWKPAIVIVGLPLNMDGTEQELTLRAKNLQIVYRDVCLKVNYKMKD